MHAKLEVAKLYANAYGHRAAETTKKTAKKGAEIVSENQTDLTILGATVSVVYLVSRAAGFKAGYKFANKPNA